MHAFQAALLHLAQEVGPARLVFLRALAYREDLAIAGLRDPDRHQHGDVLHLAAPRSLQPQTIEEDIRKLAHQRLLAPLLDLAVDLLVQIAHRRGAHPRAPQAPG